MIEFVKHPDKERRRQLAEERAHRLARLIRKESDNQTRYKLTWLMKHAAKQAGIAPPLSASDIALIGRKKRFGKALDYD